MSTTEPWLSDLRESARRFVELVWPKVGPRIGGGELVPVEATYQDEGSKAADVAEVIDRVGGVDAWQVHQEHGLRGIASRVQTMCRQKVRDLLVGRYGSPTFTVRKSRDSGARTEFAKRKAEIERSNLGYVYPHMTIHAYVDTNDGTESVPAVAAVETKRLVAHISHSDADVMKASNATFFAVAWHELDGCCANVRGVADRSVLGAMEVSK